MDELSDLTKILSISSMLRAALYVVITLLQLWMMASSLRQPARLGMVASAMVNGTSGAPARWPVYRNRRTDEYFAQLDAIIISVAQTW